MPIYKAANPDVNPKTALKEVCRSAYIQSICRVLTESLGLWNVARFRRESQSRQACQEQEEKGRRCPARFIVVSPVIVSTILRRAEQ